MGNACMKGDAKGNNDNDSNKTTKSKSGKNKKPPTSQSIVADTAREQSKPASKPAEQQQASKPASGGPSGAPKPRAREPINFSSAHLHFLWKLNRTDHEEESEEERNARMGDINSWRRRIYYVQYAVPTSEDPSPIAYLLYGSEKDEKVVELMTLTPNRFEATKWETSVPMDENTKPSWDKRLFDDEQYELAFLQRKTNLKREFPTSLHPFTIRVFDRDGNEKQSMVLGCENREDLETWVDVLAEYKPIAPQ